MSNTEQQILWGIIPIVYGTNELYAVPRATTQEDNFGGIDDRFDIYHIPYHVNNGVLSDMVQGVKPCVAKLVKYNKMNGGIHVLFINNIRIQLQKNEIVFKERF
jgi:hypothetical protein